MTLVRNSGVLEILLATVAGLVLGALGFLSPALGLLAVGAIAFVWVGMTRPVMLGYVLILVITLTSGMPRGSLVPLLIPNEAVLMATFGISLPLILIGYRRKVPFGIFAAMAILIVGMTLIPLVSYFTRGVGLSTSAVFRLISPIQFALLYLIFFTIADSEQVKRRLMHFMLICGALVALLGLLQAFNVPFVTSLLHEWYPSLHLNRVEEGVGRVTSVFGAWNTLGTYLMVVLLMVVSLMGKIQSRAEAWLLLVVGGLSAACLMASGSFAAIGGLIAGIAIIKYFDRTGLKAILWAGLVVVVISVIALQPIIEDRLDWQYGGSGSSGILPQTLVYRFKVWNEIFLPIMARHPMGAVYPTLNNVSWGYAESQYIGLHYKTGVFSLVAHLVWVGISVYWLYRRIKTTQSYTWAASVTAFTLLILLSIMGLTNEVFTYSGVMDYLWILLAFAGSGARPAGT